MLASRQSSSAFRLLLVADDSTSASLSKMLTSIKGIQFHHCISRQKVTYEALRNYDVVLIQDPVPGGLSALEWIRFLHANLLVPSWTKLLVLSTDKQNQTYQYPYRTVGCEVVSLTDSVAIGQAIEHGLKEISILKDAVEQLQQGSQRELLLTIKTIRQQALDPQLDQALQMLLVRSLFVNGHIDNAYQTSQKLTDAEPRLNAELSILHLSGQSAALQKAANKALPLLRDKALFYLMMDDLALGRFDSAQANLNRIPVSHWRVALTQLNVGLVWKTANYEAAMELCEKSFEQARVDSRLQRAESAYTACQVGLLAYLNGDIPQDSKSVSQIMQHMMRFDALAEFSLRPDANEWLQWIAMMLSQSPDRSQTLRCIEKLENISQYSTLSAWVMATILATLLRQRALAENMLLKLDARTAIQEPNGQLLLAEVIWQSLVSILYTESERSSALLRVSTALASQGLNYRAMTRAYCAWRLASNKAAAQAQLTHIMVKLNLRTYRQFSLDKQ